MIHVNVRALIERETPRGSDLLLQTRNKPHEGGTSLELPGGRVDEFESLVEALRREVREETGLELTGIEGLETRLTANGPGTSVECLQPFAVYQALRGPVDSLGVYFRCRAAGDPLPAGDDTQNARWMPVNQIRLMLAEDPGRFSWVDRAGLEFYLQYLTPESAVSNCGELQETSTSETSDSDSEKGTAVS